MSGHLRCSFCGKSKDEVNKFISGPSVYICNECIALCVEILAEDATQEKSECLTFRSDIMGKLGMNPLEVNDLGLVDEVGFDSNNFLLNFHDKPYTFEELVTKFIATARNEVRGVIKKKILETQSAIGEIEGKMGTLDELRKTHSSLQEKLKLV